MSLQWQRQSALPVSVERLPEGELASQTGHAGMPHGSGHNLNLHRLFMENITLQGSSAPVRAYIPELLADMVAGKLDASAVLDLTVDLDGKIFRC